MREAVRLCSAPVHTQAGRQRPRPYHTPLTPPPQVSPEVLAAIEELEPLREALFEAQVGVTGGGSRGIGHTHARATGA